MVAETFMDGDITPMNIANRLSCTPADVPLLMLKQVGEHVGKNEKIAESKGIFGMFKSAATADAAGTIESISSSTGQVMIRGKAIPVQVKAYLSGTVSEVFLNEGCVVENEVMLVQGIFGVGGETSGILRSACESHEHDLTADLITAEMSGAVVIGGARVTVDALRRAREVGAMAVVSGGIDDADLRNFLGFDLGVAITGSENLGITVVITEGFGEIAMAKRTHGLLCAPGGQHCQRQWSHPDQGRGHEAGNPGSSRRDYWRSGGRPRGAGRWFP